VVIANKKVHSCGSPEEVIKKEMLKEVFEIKAEIEQDSLTKTPICVLHSRIRKVK